MNNLHISLTNVSNESRLFKETKTIVENHIAKHIYIAGLWEDRLPKMEVLDPQREIRRFDLKTRNMSKSIFSQLLKYCEYTFDLLKYYRLKNIGMVNIHSLALLPIGVLFKLFYKIVLIYDAHEYETETSGLKGIRKQLAKLMEKLLIPFCDRVIVVSDSIADEYHKLYPKLPRPSVVLNTPHYTSMVKKNYFREKFKIAQNQNIFLYQGGLSRGRGIETLIDTFQNIDDNNSVIVFMGYGPMELLIQNVSKECRTIFYHPAVSSDVLLEYTGSADFGILFYENNCLNHYFCSPNKMFEYLMAEIPVIVSNLYEMKRLVNRYELGVVADENTPKGLTKAIKQAVILDKDILKTNIQNIKNIYNWEMQEKTLLKVYNDL
jgi:glycosyltransferase involved in cell wall biosynthesis